MRPGTRPNWFVAFVVPDRDGWLERHAPAEGVPERVRRFHADDLHATLAFLGAVDEARAREAFRVARADSEALPGAFAARLGNVVGMGPPGRWSALAAEPAGEGQAVLVEAIRRLRAPVLAAARRPPDDRPPRPHVTLARLARRASPSDRSRAEAWAAERDLRRVVVPIEELALYSWSEDRSRRLFRIVDRAALPASGDRPRSAW